MQDLVTQAVEDKTRKLLKKAKKKTTRVIDESDLADVFGIDFEEAVVVKKRRAKAPKKASRSKKSLMSASKKTKARSATRKPGAKTALKKASRKIRDRSLFDTVVGIIKRSRKGITASGIREKTGLDDKQIRNIVYKAKKQGRIKNLKRGVYIPA
jgi:hypothetical protein